MTGMQSLAQEIEPAKKALCDELVTIAHKHLGSFEGLAFRPVCIGKDAYRSVSEFLDRIRTNAVRSAKEEAIRKCAAFVEDEFCWSLPALESDELNEATDNAAEEMRAQIVKAILSLLDQPKLPTGTATRGDGTLADGLY